MLKIRNFCVIRLVLISSEEIYTYCFYGQLCSIRQESRLQSCLYKQRCCLYIFTLLPLAFELSKQLNSLVLSCDTRPIKWRQCWKHGWWWCTEIKLSLSATVAATTATKREKRRHVIRSCWVRSWICDHPRFGDTTEPGGGQWSGKYLCSSKTASTYSKF